MVIENNRQVYLKKQNFNIFIIIKRMTVRIFIEDPAQLSASYLLFFVSS